MKKWLANPAVSISLITAILTALLAGIKFIVGFLGQSHALIADGVHSVADVLIDILVLFAAHFGAQKADINHPYGHGRIETAATFGLAQLLIFVGLGIIWNAGQHLWGGEPNPVPDMYVLWVAIAAIVVNEFLFRYTLKIAHKLKSSLLEANAWHSRSDVAVSIVVLLAIGGALLGFPYLDAVGAVIVGIMIIKMGAGLAWRSISELVDTGVDEKKLMEIRTIIEKVPGICTLHQLRTRTINNKILVDVHILVSPRISVSEGHFIGDQVIVALKKHIPEMSDITVHVDPEDDEIEHPSVALPIREVLITQLKESWQYLPGAAQIQDIYLHYLAGKIDVEIILPADLLTLYPHDAETLRQKYQAAALQKNAALREVRVRFA